MPPGFEGHDFVVLAEHPESNQHGHKRAQRRKLVEKIRDQVAK